MGASGQGGARSSFARAPQARGRVEPVSEAESVGAGVQQDADAECARLSVVEAVAHGGDVAQIAGAGRGSGLDFDSDDGAVGPFEDEVCLSPCVVTIVIERHPLGTGCQLAGDFAHGERLEQRACRGCSRRAQRRSVDADQRRSQPKYDSTVARSAPRCCDHRAMFTSLAVPTAARRSIRVRSPVRRMSPGCTMSRLMTPPTSPMGRSPSRWSTAPTTAWARPRPRP